MIQFSKRSDLTKEVILEHISEYDILREYWPASKELKLNRLVSSPFRDDPNPSFLVSTRYGRITYKDMGRSELHGDVWTFVRQMLSLADYDSVLKEIDRRFNLGISLQTKPLEYKKQVIWEQPKIVKLSPPRIQVVTRKFAKSELDYWAEYFQGEGDLREAEIYAPKTIYRNGRRVPNTLMTFCFWYPEVEKWKLYRPTGGKSKESLISQRKWDTNLDYGYIEHLHLLPGAKLGLLTKSRKDRMVLRKALEIDTIAVAQSEDIAAIADEDFETILKAKQPLVCFDNDKKGIQAAEQIEKLYTIPYITPPLYVDVTDYADYARCFKSLAVVSDHFKQYGYI